MPKKVFQQTVHEQAIRKEVAEILEMFRCLWQSYDTLQDKSGINESLIRFDGFDDHTEYEYLQVARRMAFRPREPEVPDSQGERLGIYRKMLQQWQCSRDKKNLTRDDLVRIANIFRD